VSTHKKTHTLVAVDEVGRKLGERTVVAATEGHLDAVGWAGRWPDRVFTLEDGRHVTRPLEADLLRAGEAVRRVPTRLMASERRGGRERGKSDPIDALAVALEASATDDVLTILDEAVGTLLSRVERYGKRRRLRTLDDLDRAAMTLREAARAQGRRRGPGRRPAGHRRPARQGTGRRRRGDSGVARPHEDRADGGECQAEDTPPPEGAGVQEEGASTEPWPPVRGRTGG
jgi:transposase